jgi:hypothetical protein
MITTITKMIPPGTTIFAPSILPPFRTGSFKRILPTWLARRKRFEKPQPPSGSARAAGVGTLGGSPTGAKGLGPSWILGGSEMSRPIHYVAGDNPDQRSSGVHFGGPVFLRKTRS